MTGGMLTAAVRGQVDPFTANPTADIGFEPTFYAFREFIDPALPKLGLDGMATVAGRLSGTLKAPSIRDLGLQVLYKGGGFRLSGSAGNVLVPSGLDLAVNFEIAPPVHWTDGLPDVPLSPTYLSAEGMISGDSARLAFQN